MASYTIIDHSDTLVKVTEDGREYFYKKVYCKTDVDGNYLLFFAHELETGKLNQQYQILYSDCTNPSVASAALLKTAVDAIINDYVSGSGITALTGDVTATGPGSVAATIANDAVTYAKIQNVSAASRLLGRGDSGAGDVQEITLGSGLTMTGTSLSASGGVSDGDKGDITVSSSGATWTIDNDVVTFAKMQNIATNRLLGRGTAASGDVEEIALAWGTTGTDVSFTWAANSLTFNIPSASATARGVITTGSQTIAGGKTWTGAAGFQSTVTVSAGSTANPVTITSTNATNTTFGLSITANSGSRGMFISTNGQAQYAARSSSHTDRELRFQLFSDGHCYFGMQGLSGAITSDLIIRTSADSGSNAGAIRFALSGVNKAAITSAGIAIGSQAGALSASAYLHLMAGTTAAGTAPLKFTSGSLNTAPAVGAVEFLTDKLYAVITTGTARKEITLNDAALTSGTTPVATTNGRLTDGLILAGTTYTPTLTNVTNVTSSTAYQCQYIRVGATVTVSGKLDYTLTGAGVYEIGISLPITSNLGADEDCAGIGTGVTGTPAASDVGYIKADATNNRASLNGDDNDTGSHAHYFMFTYQII